MTKEDYIILAGALRKAAIATALGNSLRFEPNQFGGIRIACDELIAVLQRDNPAFDTERFLYAIYNGIDRIPEEQ